MSEIYNQYSTVYLFEGDPDPQPPQLITFLPTTPIFCSSQARESLVDHHHHDHQQPQASGCNPKSADGSSNADASHTKKFMCDSTGSGSSVGWVSSKIRLMKKMINSDLQHPQHLPSSGNNNNDHLSNAGLRVCSACNTTKTPLWRSGPQGPKSLCNACGIRQRKARKALAAAAATNSGTSRANASTEGKEIKSLQKNRIPLMPFKKRCKFTAPHDQKGLNDLNLRLSLGQQNPGLHPQEKEAAILLMAMSCNVICR